jgi:hypothetical protein
MTTLADKKITMATVKSFIKNNFSNLCIRTESHFNGMTDGVDYIKGAQFESVIHSTNNINNTLGVSGAWFVGSSRDYFNNGEFEGVEVYNACGSFVIAIKIK